MAFFTLDPALQESLDQKTNPILIILEIADDSGSFIRLPGDALNQGVFHSYKDSLGGYCVLAKISFRDKSNLLAGLSGQNREFRILFSSGDCALFLQRFTLQANDKGFIRTRRGGENQIDVTLEDAPSRIKRLGSLRNWEEKQTLTDLVMSDKSTPESSLLHLIAARAGIDSSEIDCSAVSLPLVYARLTGNPWEELCALASSCRALIEGGIDFKLLFSASPYSTDQTEEEISTLSRDLFYELSEEDAGELSCNSVRLKWNRPERLEEQILWEYEEPPVVFDAGMIPSYPFLPAGDRPIQDDSVPYKAPFEVREEYKRLPVLWADAIQNQAAVEVELVFEADAGGSEGLSITNYTAESQKAVINLSCSQAGSLKKLSIQGRPIVMRSGTACYLSDEEDIARNGLKIRLGDSRFFSDANVTGEDHIIRAHPEDWVRRELSDGLERRRRYRGRSELGLFYVRAGALCSLEDGDESILCRVEDLLLDYHKSRGLECQITLLEEKNG
jgi:hypothetical protein